MPHRPLLQLALLVALALLLAAGPAQAWVETAVVAHEARVQLSRQGNAQVEHKVTLRVRGGPLRAFDMKIADRNVTLSKDAWLIESRQGVTEKLPVPVSIEQRPGGDLRISIDGGQGVRRGVYQLALSYEVDLLQQNRITRDGSMLQVTWVGPSWSDGIDSAQCTFAVPASPTEPRAIGGINLGGGASDIAASGAGAFLASLTRLPEFDELTLVRPHVTSHESVVWRVRIDPKALGEVNDPRLRPAPVEAQAPELPAERRALYLALAGAAALLFSVLAAIKHQHVTEAAGLRGAVPRPLVPVNIAVRVAFVGPVLGVGLGMQALLDDPLPGTLVILSAAALIAYRTPLRKTRPRGPGRWLPLSDGDAFEKREATASGWLDASLRSGRIVLGMVATGWAVGVYFVAGVSAYHAHLAALDFVVIAALFCTGRHGELPAHPVHSSARFLQQLAQSLRKSMSMAGCRISGVARLPAGTTVADELRLTIRPKHTLRGFVAAEVGVAWAHGAGGSVAVPQILLRVSEGTPCHEQLTQRVRHARWLRGREPYERVLVFTPPLPSLDITAAHVQAIVRAVRATASAAPSKPSRPIARAA